MKSKALKFLTLLAALCAVTAVMLGVLTACGNPNDNSEKSVTLYIGDTSVSVTTNSADVLGLLTEMKADGKITFEYTSPDYDGQKDAFVSSIGNLTPGGNEYIAIYHTIDDIALQSPIFPSNVIEPVEMFGKSFWYSGVGVKRLPVKDGASYAFKISSFA